MIIVRFQGGLGNQMFQYALLVKLKRMYPETKVVADITSYRASKPHNGFELNKLFKLKHLNCASDIEIFNISGNYPHMGSTAIQEKDSHFYKIVRGLIRRINIVIDLFNKHSKKNDLNIVRQRYISGYPGIEDLSHIDINKDWYIDGTWFNINYDDVRNELVEEFELDFIKGDSEIGDLYKKIKNENSVSVHYRRGDYSAWGFTILSKEYYIAAIDKIKNSLENPVFYVFSDDIAAVENEIKSYPNVDDVNFRFVCGNNEKNAFVDLYLMAECKHHIIANSTFSAIAASVLSKNSNCITIAPRYWMDDNEIWHNDSWTTI